MHLIRLGIKSSSTVCQHRSIKRKRVLCLHNCAMRINGLALRSHTSTRDYYYIFFSFFYDTRHNGFRRLGCGKTGGFKAIIIIQIFCVCAKISSFLLARKKERNICSPTTGIITRRDETEICTKVKGKRQFSFFFFSLSLSCYGLKGNARERERKEIKNITNECCSVSC